MIVHVEVDTSDVEHELHRLEAGPNREDLLELYMVLFGQFQLTQAHVHVDTASLRRSGKVEFDYDYDTWTGEIIYGGDSPRSIYDPVTYAAFEQQRDFSHDFMREIYGGSHGYVTAITDFYEGRRA